VISLLSKFYTYTGDDASQEGLRGRIVKGYIDQRQDLDSAMAQLRRAAEFLRLKPKCVWARYQCHMPNRNLEGVVVALRVTT